MRICFIPIDNRPVCWQLPLDIASCNLDVEFYIPPRELLGGLVKPANVEGIYNWLQSVPKVDYMVVSLDTIAYGGLVSSRRTNKIYEQIVQNLEKFKNIFENKADKVFAFSSIMRISNNNINIEEKEYWSKYGKKIFEYSYNRSKTGSEVNNNGIPTDILSDYLSGRERNFKINKLYLDWKKSGIFDILIFSKDDCAEYGLNVDEANLLYSLGGDVMTGADEIPLTLLARTLEEKISVCPVFTEENSKNLISNYEDISVEQSVLRQAELAGYELKPYNEADLILVVNNFKKNQGEIVMKFDTEPYSGEFVTPNKPYFVADVRFANGSDNEFVKSMFKNGRDNNFIGYAAWNTTANTVGSLLCLVKFVYLAKRLNPKTYENLLATRFIDDWAYQANVRQQCQEVKDISGLMLPYIKQIEKYLGQSGLECSFSFPWDRLFEVEVSIKSGDRHGYSRNYTFSNSSLD